ncbi:helix-turn-helix domain-containing protein [Propionispira raffinosivorans]|uniref:helix-turn-helix domain-containing protein n=1 Tax=Propionispira raffinosivorans TaxID=86959 RepID=UPI00037D980B|nr:helix-turn-helix domain-containing protein [Propionispira raffinosivorans]
MYNRIKKIRQSLKLNQAEFSKLLGMGQSTLGMLEVGKREILDRHIKTICSIFNVNETWLRTGIGEMFIEPDDSAIEHLAKTYNLDKFDQQLLLTYLELPKSDRAILKKYILNLSAKISAPTFSTN